MIAICQFDRWSPRAFGWNARLAIRSLQQPWNIWKELTHQCRTTQKHLLEPSENKRRVGHHKERMAASSATANGDGEEVQARPAGRYYLGHTGQAGATKKSSDRAAKLKIFVVRWHLVGRPPTHEGQSHVRPSPPRGGYPGLASPTALRKALLRCPTWFCSNAVKCFA